MPYRHLKVLFLTIIACQSSYVFFFFDKIVACLISSPLPVPTTISSLKGDCHMRVRAIIIFNRIGTSSNTI